MVKDDFFNQIFQENINGHKYFVFDNGKKTWIILMVFLLLRLC